MVIKEDELEKIEVAKNTSQAHIYDRIILGVQKYFDAM